MRRNWIVAIYQMIAAVAIAYGTLGAHSILIESWFWAYLLSANLVTFLFFGFDKVFVAILQSLKIRVPEIVLIWGLAFPGGMVGAWVAMRTFRHKTSADKRSFRNELRAAVFVQVLAVVGFGLLVQVGVVSLESLEGAIESAVGLVPGFIGRIFGLLRSSVT